MGEILNFPTDKDSFFYRIAEDNNIVGVGTNLLIIENIGESGVLITPYDVIDKSDLKELMIMWLAINYPDVLKYDGE